MEQIRLCLSMLDRQAKLRLVGLAMLILVQTVMEVASIGLILPFVALVNDPGLIDTYSIVRTIQQSLGLSSPRSFLVGFGLALLGLMLVKNAYSVWLAHVQARFCSRQTAILSTRLLGRYLGAPYEYHLHRNSSDMILTADKFVDHIFTFVVTPAIMLVTELATVLGIVGLMIVVEPKLSLLLGTAIGGSAFLLARLLKVKLTAMSEQSVGFYANRMRTIQQALTSIKDVKITGREQFFLAAYRKLRSAHAAVETTSLTLAQIPRPILESIISGGIVLVIITVLLQDRGTAEIFGVLGLFALGAVRIMPGVNRIVNTYTSIKHHASIVDRVAKDVFDTAMSGDLRGTSQRALNLTDAIELRNVSFTYAGTSAPTIKQISMVIRRGEAVALVGPSGAGKSTLADVLLGLLPPQEGQVLIDGRDVTHDLPSWRQIVGYVPQSTSLIDDTLRNNVAFGFEPDQIDDADVWKVLRLASITDYVRALPEGLDTMLGERGVRLSGGQRQRIGVARALYRNPEVLVLDEATSALDNEIERQMTEAIEALHGEITVIVIAHRLSTIERCDRLFLLHHGTILDSGTFQELVARNQGFREMARHELTPGARDAARTSQVVA